MAPPNDPELTWWQSHPVAVRTTDGQGNPLVALRYGVSVRFGSITCTSTTTGMRCINSAGRGFTASQSTYVLHTKTTEP